MFKHDDDGEDEVSGHGFPNMKSIEVMPFGKYKGVKINEVPHNYLKYIRQFVYTNDLKFAIDKELQSTTYAYLYDEEEYDSYIDASLLDFDPFDP